jgi:hypothetical protein
MKNLLLFLLALIVVPVWAEGSADAPMKAAPDIQTSVNIVLKGSPGSVSALVAALEKDAVYKDAGCSSKPARKSGKMAKISCAKADSALMEFLSKNASAKVHWSISATTSAVSSPLSCPTGCVFMNCPPPGGPALCCKKTSTGYKPC